MSPDPERRGAGNVWGIILAGGDGRRVRSLMRRLTGIDLPKQYCAVIGRRSMLQHTWDRAATLIPRHRIVTVITRHHLDQAWAQLQEWPTEQLLIQPSNRETAPGLLLPLLAIQARDPKELARRMGFGLFQVRRFLEKPDPLVSEQFFLQGGLWNSLVLVGRVDTFLGHIREALPELWASFQAVASALGTVIEARILEEVYGAIPARNLSAHLLEQVPHHLGVVPVKGVHWCDWGDEARIFGTLTRIGKAEELMARLRETTRPPSREAA